VTDTLSARLDELWTADLVYRVSYDEVPPHVEDAATRKATDLLPVFEELCEWALVHQCDTDCVPTDSCSPIGVVSTPRSYFQSVRRQYLPLEHHQ